MGLIGLWLLPRTNKSKSAVGETADTADMADTSEVVAEAGADMKVSVAVEVVVVGEGDVLSCSFAGCCDC